VITADQFRQATGRDPEQDDLERVNCPNAGEVGHWGCGWDKRLNLPVFEVGFSRAQEKMR